MNKTDIKIKKVGPSEAPALSQLAHLAKAYWGYPPEFMEACDEELNFNADDLNSDRYVFRVGVKKGAIRSFYALDLESGPENTIEMTALFVEPTAIGKGFGRLLFEHSLKLARKLGATTMMIHSDPYAEGFYTKMGAVTVGTVPSGSIEGRELPLMKFEL